MNHVQVMDVLMLHTRSLGNKDRAGSLIKAANFFDTKFVSLLGRNYPEFNKVATKDSHQFQKRLLQFFVGMMAISKRQSGSTSRSTLTGSIGLVYA